jgi:conjugative relaxase-like TrwC/TraI family protein
VSETNCHNGIRDRSVGVLSVAKVTSSAAGGYAEYLEGKTHASNLGDYYLKDGERTEAPGRWAGGADHFAIDPHRPVTGQQLHTLMDVRRPDTGAELRRVGGTGEAVAAIDATFSAPKSVSAVWALASPEMRARIEHAHETAVDRALTYATEQVPMLRRRVNQDTAIHEKATGLVATSWRHTTARAVEEQVPDPQLHSHVLLHGAVRRDGRIVAIDSRAWLVHRREVGAAYRTELARELNQLGFAVQRATGRGQRYFELAGVPQPLIDRWSSRHHEVQAAIRDRLADQAHELHATITTGGPAAVDAARQLEALMESGQLSPKQERMMATASRGAKVPVTIADLDSAWQTTGHAHRLSRERVQVLRRQTLTPLLPASAADVRAGLTEFDATFPARDARAVALERSAGAPIQHALEQLRALRASDEILVLADRTGTTREHRGRERTVVAITQRLTQTQVTPLPTQAAEREADRLDRELSVRGGRLSDEQRTAIHLGCGARPLVIIQGQAGTGKSTALTGIARAHQACGQQILVTSTAALASERLATELSGNGVDCHAYSTAALTSAIHHGRVVLTPRTTIIHDEAALASTREQLDLLKALDTSGARLIAVGDPQQSQPVGAGGLWQHIETAARDADAHAELTHNQRARDPADRRDQALFRHGHAERSIRGYAARDHIHLHHDTRRAEDHALDAADRDRAQGRTTTVIAQTSNDHLDALNARAQAIRHQAGQLGDDSLPVPGRPYQLRQGDQLQIRHTIQHPTHGPLRNGTPAQITTIDADADALELQLSDGAQLSLTGQQIADADLRLAYVQHPFPAQGQTTDTTHLIIAEHATREGTYVALTRARETTSIYASDPLEPIPDGDRLQMLADHVSRTEPDTPSIRLPLAPGPELDTEARIETNTPGNPSAITHERETITRTGTDDPRPVESGDTKRDWNAIHTRETEAATEFVPRETRERARVGEPAQEREQGPRRWPQVRDGTQADEFGRDRGSPTGFEP